MRVRSVYARWRGWHFSQDVFLLRIPNSVGPVFSAKKLADGYFITLLRHLVNVFIDFWCGT